MSYQPGSLVALQDYLVGQTGLPRVSLGIVGNVAHKSGYHLGKDRIFGPDGQGAKDYSVKTDEDRAGLTNAAMAMDIGNFSRLQEMSKWLVGEARKNAPGTADLREIIYSPDGVLVLRWDRERGWGSQPRPGEADSSHRTHTHVSWYRNTEQRDKVGLFRRFFEEDAMGIQFKIDRSEAGKATVNGPGHFSLTVSNDGREPLGPTDSADTYAHGRIINTPRDPALNGQEARVFNRKGEMALMLDRDITFEAGDDAEIEAAKLEGRQEEWDRQAAEATVSLLPRP